ncbi:HAD superfamily hydrolase (TIGR01490 family) [Isoptericola jiangsuensis]|uniref:HAD superfamily hydrolase (TIGR01490 family) n=1 Tax=Isoptericola jiangsuensis TaxID=548579 RepID=A0A2A9ESH2_9MICO|nr:HAD-IB family hydrolase [Isoptericola jiangsuensis]PFG42097.1 HAD superfamily hydrolase (TIGR01490 family) [Isoptericola jiangsuensis]
MPSHPTPPRSSGAAAFFDVDNTIIRGASSFHLARALYQRRFFGTADLLRFGLIQAKYLVFGESRSQIETVRTRALSLIAGRSVAEVTAVGEEVYDTVLALRIFPGTKRLLDEHLAAGDQVWLVTATPVEIGGLIARRLGGTGCLGTVAEHSGGYYTGALIGDLMHGEAKGAAVRELAEREGIDLDASYAYGDSLNDLPMMRSVGHPCPINPDARLRRFAKEVGWPIREFRGRGQRAAGRGVRTASWAGAAWVAGLVVRAARRSLRKRLQGR